jgi:uncharacterized protein YyaL (SSP411 family)
MFRAFEGIPTRLEALYPRHDTPCSMNDEPGVAWRDWGEAAFADAERTGRPVLLSITATWCAPCHEMDAETYADPRIVAAVEDGFVPVRVDADRRPRVRERYTTGGFPTTAFLTPDGRVLASAGALAPAGMRQVLDRVREAWDAKGSEAGRVPRALADEAPPAGEVTTAIEEHLAGQLTAQYDDEHAGWGTDAKFPLPRTVEFALQRERDLALRTLDAVRDHLYDEAAGGFFRFAGRRDWGDVHYEKTLDANAALLRAFANAHLYTGEEAYLDPVERTTGFLVDRLWTGEAFGGSLGPAGGGAYYALPVDERADEPGPRADLTAFAGANALAADALLTHHAYTDDERAREYAERTLDALVRLTDDGAVAHYRGDGAPTCVLSDQARVTGAFARAGQVLGSPWTARARTVADATLDLQDDTGAFRDGPDGAVGMLDRPFRPLDGSVEAAEALCDVAALTGERRYRERAREAVAAFAGARERFGVQVAGYGSVASRLCGGAPVVAVADDPGSRLHRAALRVADHETVVRPEADGPGGTARVRREGTGAWSEPATTPAELMTRLRSL